MTGFLSLICAGYWKILVGKHGGFNPLYLLLFASITLAIIFAADYVYRIIVRRKSCRKTNFR